MSLRPFWFMYGLLLGMLLFIALSCTPNEVAAFGTLSPADQQRVLDALAAEQRPTDCYGALHHFPGDRATARRIIHRESRNQPAAANPSSSARGCWQLIHSLHSWRYSAVGCSPSQWADPVCSTKAAAHLYRQAGWTPWGY